MKRNKEAKAVTAGCIFILALCPVSPARTIYVDDDAAHGGDGSSWARACQSLQDALAIATTTEGPVEVWVAEGIYRPDQGKNQTRGDRAATFQLINGVTLKGGYAGAGAEEPNARDMGRYETILSGDLASDDVSISDPCDLLGDPSRSDNSYHVVTASGTEPNAVLDGFTITGGNAEPFLPTLEPPYEPEGGGIHAVSGSPTVVSCRFAWNLAGRGGAIHASQSGLALINCTFTSNMAAEICTEHVGRDRVITCSGGHGGAVQNVSGSPKISGCTFTGNIATYGGGMSTGPGLPVLEDCLFLRNTAYKGGGVYCGRSSPKLLRCTFHANVGFRADVALGYVHGGYGGGMANESVTDAELVDCVFTENWAQDGGGAINNNSADLLLVGCTFTRNSTPSWGGAMSNWHSKVRLLNCLLEGNIAGEGAIHNRQGTALTLINCTLVANSGKYGKAFVFRRDRGTMELANCIVRNGAPEIGNENNSILSIAYTNITDGWAGEGNMDVDPYFAAIGHWDPNGTPDDPNDDSWIQGDYHLKSEAGRWDPVSETWVKDDVTSPCIDAGDPNTPIGQEPFPNGGRINMGAYGGTAEAGKSWFGEPPCETIIAGDINGDGRVDSEDLVLLARHWLEGIPHEADRTYVPPAGRPRKGNIGSR